jgi:hypothetical protein
MGILIAEMEVVKKCIMTNRTNGCLWNISIGVLAERNPMYLPLLYRTEACMLLSMDRFHDNVEIQLHLVHW